MTHLNSLLTIIKSLLYYVFDWLALLVPAPVQKSQFTIILLIRQDAIGDFIMWLDTAKEYRKLYPPEKYKILLVGNKIWHDLAIKLPYWDKVIPVDLKQFKSFSNYRWRLMREIRKLKIHTAIQPTYSREFYNGDSLIRASGAVRKVSSVGDMANRNWVKKFLADRWHTELIPASTAPLTELERNAEFFSGLTDNPHLTRYPKLDVKSLRLSPKWKEKIFYIIVPGTSGAVEGKEWPPNFFSELAKKIFRQTGWVGIICGTKEEYGLGEIILKQCDAPLKNYCGQTSLIELAGLLSQGKLTISNDTGSVFLSSAVGTMSICILGGGHFGRFVPYPDLPGQANYLQAVYYKMPCYGCNWSCIFPIIDGESAQCISNISVGLVWEKICSLITNKNL